jgi:hypothetical protein
MDKFRLFLRQQTDELLTSICLMCKLCMDEEKSPWNFVFRLSFERTAYIYSSVFHKFIYSYIYVYKYTENGTNGNPNFPCIGRQTINGNQRLLFQQTCPSMDISDFYKQYFYKVIREAVTSPDRKMFRGL